MKTIKEALITLNRRFILPVCSLFLLSGIPVLAADGAWSGTNGNWSDSANWNGGAVADGATFTATFGNLNATGTRTVTLDGNRTIGGLNFTSSSAVNTTRWVIDGSGVLTLSNGASSPVINVNNSTGLGFLADITGTLSGTNGFTKEGSGTLYIRASQLLSGDVTINQGRVDWVGNNADMISSLNSITNINLNNGSILGFNQANAIATEMAGNTTLNIGVGGGTILAASSQNITLGMKIVGSEDLTINHNSPTANNNRIVIRVIEAPESGPERVLGFNLKG